MLRHGIPEQASTIDRKISLKIERLVPSTRLPFFGTPNIPLSTAVLTGHDGAANEIFDMLLQLMEGCLVRLCWCLGKRRPRARSVVTDLTAFELPVLKIPSCRMCCRTRHWTLPHDVSLTYLTYLPTFRFTAEWRMYTGQPHMVQSDDLEPGRIELDRNIGTDPYQRLERIWEMTTKIRSQKIRRKLEIFGVDMPYVQSTIHSDCDSAESIADSDLEDEESPKMLARAWSQIHLKSVWEPDAVFSLRSDEPGNQFESSMFQIRWSVKIGKISSSLLEGNKDHLLSQARSELVKQEHQVGSLNCCVNELQQQAYAQGLELQDAQHGYIESRREQVRLQEEFAMKDRFSEILKYEIFMNCLRWKELKNYELTKSQCKNYEKIMRQYRDSRHNCCPCKNTWILWTIQGNFKKWNRITMGDCVTLPVSQKWFQVLPLCWAATKSLPYDTWNAPWLQNVFCNQFSTFGLPRNLSQGIYHGVAHKTQNETESVPRATGTGTSFTRDDKQSRGTIPMPTFARRPSTMSSLIPVAIPLISMVGQQRSELQLIHNNFCLENKIQESSDYLFGFSIGHYVMDQRSGDGRFIGRIKVIAIGWLKDFPRLWDAGREDCFCFE